MYFEKNDGEYTHQIALDDELFEEKGNVKDIRDTNIIEKYIQYTVQRNSITTDDLPF